MPKKIHVFGDSHAAFFMQSPFYVGRLGLNFPLSFHLEGESIPAASIMGFRPKISTLNTKEKIAETLPEASRMILAFGQVDLELGFYYRRFIKGEEHSMDSFSDLLIKVYEGFIEDITGRVDLAIKGMNLTALSPRAFSARYIARVITENNPMSLADAEKQIFDQVLAEDDQNRMHLLFNEKLQDMCERLGIRYFDLVQQTSAGGISGVTMQKPRLADIYKTAKFDHHLADTIAVRKMHYVAAGSVFGLC